MLIRVHCQNFTSIAQTGPLLERFESLKRDFSEFFDEIFFFGLGININPMGAPKMHTKDGDLSSNTQENLPR